MNTPPRPASHGFLAHSELNKPGFARIDPIGTGFFIRISPQYRESCPPAVSAGMLFKG